MAERRPVLRVQPGDDFVMTPSIEALCTRALTYLEAGYPVHFCGLAGTGKTTLAMHLAGLRDRPVTLICGDEEFGSSDLVGAEKGIVSRRLIDNFIHSVLKTEESVRTQWVDNRLTTACKYGHTLVYDEFSRSRPEANNVLLSVLEEKLVALPEACYEDSYMMVHPEFRAIFTSNPWEYAGVHKTQNALLDRMITIRLEHYDRQSEIAVTTVKSKLPAEEAAKVVDLIRALRTRGSASGPSVRASIMIAQIVSYRNARVTGSDPIFVDTCFDVLGSDGIAREDLLRLMERQFGIRKNKGARRWLSQKDSETFPP